MTQIISVEKIVADLRVGDRVLWHGHFRRVETLTRFPGVVHLGLEGMRHRPQQSVPTQPVVVEEVA